MVQQVSLFGGRVTIPEGAYLAMIRFPYTQYDATASQEADPSHRDDNSDGENIGDIVERWLAEKARAALKRERKFRTTQPRYHKSDPKPRIPPEVEIADPYGIVPKANSWGTNQILEQILGLTDDPSRTRFLMKLMDGNCTDDRYEKCIEGAHFVRAAFHLAEFYGLMETYSGNPQKRANIFRAVLDSVRKGSVPLTDSLIEHFGLKEMPGLMGRNQPFREFDALVPNGHVYTIASAMEMSGLRHLRGQDLMMELGYKAIHHAGTPVLYYMPKPK